MIKLTAADKAAIAHGDSAYINEKGVRFFQKNDCEAAVEYYRLASSMGNMEATKNLGYCYLYGNHIEPNIDLAIQYFEIAAMSGVVAAIYKLGDIYSSSKWIKQDKELSSYYFRVALEYITSGEYEELFLNKDLFNYPSLMFAIARESMSGGMLTENPKLAYECLAIAFYGYSDAIADGDSIHSDCLDKVVKLLGSKELKDAKKAFEEHYYESLDQELKTYKENHK